LATIQELATYWGTQYDWRKVEARLNALPQFTTEIDGVDIHFIHVKAEHEHALPLIMTHGWPGSVIELLDTVGPLTDPTAHGGRAEDAFDLVLPSLPGYGFTREPTEVGWNAGRVAQAWAELMHRLGYTRYVAQGGDVGAAVTDAMGRQAPEGLLGIHLNLLVTVLAGPQPAESEQERAAADQLATLRESVPAKAGRATSNSAMSCGVVPVWTRSATISPTTGTNLNPWPEKPQASTVVLPVVGELEPAGWPVDHGEAVELPVAVGLLQVDG
jgi:pimeloyl-ACP methyl ester carboxylesterase